MCCPDQSSYELALRASLLDGNRYRGMLHICPEQSFGQDSLRVKYFVTLRYEACCAGSPQGRPGQFMGAVFVPTAIATCAPGRASVNCPNKKVLTCRRVRGKPGFASGISLSGR